jgi:hypothetical protein
MLFVPLLGAVTKCLALLELAVMPLSLVLHRFESGLNVLTLQTMEYDMKDDWTIEEYLEYVKHLLIQAEEDGYTL